MINEAPNQPVVLITGCNGFTGRHLTRYLRALDAPPHIVGFDISHSGNPGLGVEIVGDVRKPRDLANAFRVCRPDIVIHLAGAMPPASDDALREINVEAAAAVLQTASESDTSPRVLMIGSAAEYGATGETRVSEDHGCNPVGAYGLTKLEQTRLCQSYANDRGLTTFIARPFNLFGPGMSSRTVIGEICSQIAAAAEGDLIRLGNLDTARDFLDVRDAVAAYWSLSQNGSPGQIYNICSGRSVRIRDMAEQLVALSGKRLEVVSCDERRKPRDIQYSCGDCTKIVQLTQWSPERELIDSLKDVLNSFTPASIR